MVAASLDVISVVVELAATVAAIDVAMVSVVVSMFSVVAGE